MSIRERIASWIYPEAFEDEWEDVSLRESDTPRVDPNLSFKIYNTNDGNKIVEFYQYDPKGDRSKTQLYIIAAEDDFGMSLSKIAMLYSLSK